MIDVMACKRFDAPHKHATNRTKIYTEKGMQLGPRFEVCPFDTLRARDEAFHYIPELRPMPIRIVS